MRRLHSQRGATAVELALVLPLVLGLLGIVFIVGLGMGMQGLLHRGVEAGARAGAVVVSVGATDVATRYRSDEQIEAAVREAMILDLAPAVVVSWDDEGRGEGARFTVTATYTWSTAAARLVAPITGATVASDGITFRARAVRVRE